MKRPIDCKIKNKKIEKKCPKNNLCVGDYSYETIVFIDNREMDQPWMACK
jgi:hypothetical protein